MGNNRQVIDIDDHMRRDLVLFVECAAQLNGMLNIKKTYVIEDMLSRRESYSNLHALLLNY
jgi:hypothetical protein